MQKQGRLFDTLDRISVFFRKSFAMNRLWSSGRRQIVKLRNAQIVNLCIVLAKMTLARLILRGHRTAEWRTSAATRKSLLILAVVSCRKVNEQVYRASTVRRG
jgi:hypothetical protein